MKSLTDITKEFLTEEKSLSSSDKKILQDMLYKFLTTTVSDKLKINSSEQIMSLLLSSRKIISDMINDQKDM